MCGCGVRDIIQPHNCAARRLDSVLEQIALEDCPRHSDLKCDAGMPSALVPPSRASIAPARAQQARPLSPSFQRRPLTAFVDKMPRSASSAGASPLTGCKAQSFVREAKFAPAQRSPSPLVPAPASPRLLRANSPLLSPAASRFEEYHRGPERAALACMKPLVPVDVMGVGVRMADQKSKQFQDHLRLMGL
jgi:hypothetical protein